MKTSAPGNDNNNDNNCSPLVNRRVVLKGSAAGSLLLVVLPAGCSQAVSPPTGPVPGGNVSSVPVESLRVVSGENVALGRDGGGLYAMSAACTHAGCLLQTVGSTPARGLSCPCHASLFDGNGAVTRGPAAIPLQHYRVDVASDGAITIQGGQPVSADARTTVD
ncbi:MAG: cytochrome b6-f complex iron-sulfur subunit [Myxococcales bacterium]|jgi:Rieske Fe-S protein|nr:cytochrome b6-f complex iron-sulfur subunit [Myxococcales bacterium]